MRILPPWFVLGATIEGAEMPIREISVQRFSVISSRSMEEVVGAIRAALGHPEMSGFSKQMAGAKTFAELEAVVQAAVGPSGFLEFVHFDLGEVLRKRSGTRFPQNVRIVLGNPVVMSSMAEHVPDAGSYAPVTILIDQRKDGVHLSYDRMASYLAPYGSREALEVARNLDSKVEGLLKTVAASESNEFKSRIA